MRKLRLDLADLAVSSFVPNVEDAPRPGTVQAHEVTAVLAPTRGNTCQTCYTNCLPYC
ncbi:MAG TPA: hypothetical protein VHG08_10885 [Longimicrobium sp.]|nr:hypothetical protein [Longimicrobium sp.]